ncbi:MAG TPA: hypothetical protein VHE81_06615 [Lacipirellulaceae bacterium]|jgi:hypothetical protein|nr:hypothetical protein [Lacipirellulaceae bacterium]
MTVQTFDTRSLNMLVARLIEEETRTGNSLVNGSASTLEEYRELVGLMRGLKKARDFCESVETDLRKGK